MCVCNHGNIMEHKKDHTNFALVSAIYIYLCQKLTKSCQSSLQNPFSVF